MGNHRAHLHNRAFTTERQPGTDGKQPAKELHRDETGRRRRQLLVQRCFDVWDAAPGSVRSKSSNQPGGKRDGRRSACGYQQKAYRLVVVSSEDQRIAKSVCLFEGKPENRADQSRRRACDKGEEAQHQKTALTPGRIDGKCRLWVQTV
jgi:hypothetical protein